MPRLSGKPLPDWIPPCEPTLVANPPSGPGWVHEIKWDGYRVSAYLNAGMATIRTRRGHDWTARFPTIARDMAALKVESAIIDGEAVVLDDAGKSSFAALQAALTRHGANNAAFYAFDLLFLNGADLRENPLKHRRAALRKLIKPNSVILFSHKFAGDGSALFRSACEYDLEGIVSKRLDSPYRSGKSKDWLKTKCVQSGVFVIIGYQPAAGGTLANLKVAWLDEAGLRYAGAVGTGFSEARARALRARLDGLVAPRSAVPGLKVKSAVWIKPELAAEVSYRGVTSDGELRHASFKGLAE